MANITTTLGLMDEQALEKREGGEDHPGERVSWVEYWYQGQLVHRSVHIEVKHALTASADLGTLG